MLGSAEVAVVSEAEGGLEWTTFARSRIRVVESRPSLSCHVMTLLGPPDEPPLAVLRFTNRQRQAMENIQFTLEQALEGVEVPPTDADAEYVEGLAKPIRDAQALRDSPACFSMCFPDSMKFNCAPAIEHRMAA